MAVSRPQTDLYLGQVPLRPGAASQVVVGLPSLVHRLDPLSQDKKFSVIKKCSMPLTFPHKENQSVLTALAEGQCRKLSITPNLHYITH